MRAHVMFPGRKSWDEFSFSLWGGFEAQHARE